VYETVRLYRDGGAAQHLAEFRDQVRGCPRTGEDAYRLVKTDFAGDGSLLTAITSPGDYGGQTVTKTLLAAVVRVGDVVLVYYAHGWEAADARADLLDRLVPV